jgi:hypothetical protein
MAVDRLPRPPSRAFAKCAGLSAKEEKSKLAIVAGLVSLHICICLEGAGRSWSWSCRRRPNDKRPMAACLWMATIARNGK